LLSARVVEEFERKVRHDPGCHEEETKHQDILQQIAGVEETAKEIIHELLDSATAIRGAAVLCLFAWQHAWAVGPLFSWERTNPTIILGPFICGDKSIIASELGNDQTFEDIVTRSDIVRGQEEATQVLRAHNETGKEVVDTDKHRVQDLRCRHASNAAHKGLAKVTVQR
jgi:hypothetical protein